MADVIRVASWNVARRPDAWQVLLDAGVDLALLQEATPPPPGLAGRVEVDPSPWEAAGSSARRPWRAAVARFSDRVRIRPWPIAPIAEAGPGELAVSRPGTLAVAEATLSSNGEVVTLASAYGAWEEPVPSSGSDWI